MVINQALASIVGVLQTFPVERAAIARELVAGDYAVATYFFAKTVASLPFEVLFPAVFATVCFFMMNFIAAPSAVQWASFAGTVVLSASVSTSMGYFVSALAPTVAVALAIAPVVLLPFILFAGYLLNLSSISPAFKPLEVLSLFKYAFAALMKIVWQDVATIDCGGTPLCPFPSGGAVLNFLSLGEGTPSIAADAAALAGLAVGWRLVALCVMWLRSPKASG